MVTWGVCVCVCVQVSMYICVHVYMLHGWAVVIDKVTMVCM